MTRLKSSACQLGVYTEGPNEAELVKFLDFMTV